MKMISKAFIIFCSLTLLGFVCSKPLSSNDGKLIYLLKYFSGIIGDFSVFMLIQIITRALLFRFGQKQFPFFVQISINKQNKRKVTRLLLF